MRGRWGVFKVRCSWQTSRDGIGDTTEAMSPGCWIETGSHLGDLVLEGFPDPREMDCLDGRSFLMLVVEMSQLASEGVRIIQQRDSHIQTVNDPDDMGLELGAVHVINIDPLEEILGFRMSSEQILEDSQTNLDSMTRMLGVPDALPQFCDFPPVLG